VLASRRRFVRGRTTRWAGINFSSIGLQTNTPRFSAYVASKAALRGVHW
jgi:NAD(P)-dependent dehydrogenase (short-subunit alcohol dehydrogenase family)